MKSNFLNELLIPLDKVEKIQEQTGKNINDIHLNYNIDTPKIPSEGYFKKGNIFINKHHRFSYMPSHTHSFIELNYMYHGNCVQYINNEKIKLNSGDIILMDKDVVQRIDYIGKPDILINILIKDNSILKNVLNNLSQSDSVVTKFMFNAYKVNAIHNNFILFNAKNNEIALNLINSLIIKYFSKSNLKNRELNLLLSLLLTELTQSIEIDTQNFSNSDDTIIQILKYIDEHYKEVTLERLSSKFGYNTNYLSNKIKDSTGNTFQELINDKRLTTTKNLLLDTDYSVDKISEEVGFKSYPSLYKLFIKNIGTTPTEYRNSNRIKDQNLNLYNINQ